MSAENPSSIPPEIRKALERFRLEIAVLDTSIKKVPEQRSTDNLSLLLSAKDALERQKGHIIAEFTSSNNQV